MSRGRKRYWFVLNIETAECAPVCAPTAASAKKIVASKAFGYDSKPGPEWVASRATVPQERELKLAEKVWEGEYPR